MTLKNISLTYEQKFELTKDAIKSIKKILHVSNHDPRNLVQILQDLQDEFRYLPEKVISYIAKEMNVSEHKIYGVATFYNQFKFIKPGKHKISVCVGTACHVKGAPSLINKLTEVLKIEPGETTKDEQFSLESVFCLDCCASAPVMVVDDDVYGNMTSAKIKRTLSKYQKKGK